ncbi:MAG: hypothetical protein A07HR67_02741 [uncultured archaeon A07HR67]|nr:MAG: hypothetical protein A07HR67_02741 [uncultured archaeon A07HR67]
MIHLRTDHLVEKGWQKDDLQWWSAGMDPERNPIHLTG